MIEQQAKVTSVVDGKVWLLVERQSSCHNCQLNKGCGTASLGRLFGLKAQQLQLPNSLDLKLGDRVIVAIPDQSYLLASVLIYVLPLLLLFIFGGVVESLWQREWLTVIMSLVGLLCGLLISARLSRVRFSSLLQPKIIRQIW